MLSLAQGYPEVGDKSGIKTQILLMLKATSPFIPLPIFSASITIDHELARRGKHIWEALGQRAGDRTSSPLGWVTWTLLSPLLIHESTWAKSWIYNFIFLNHHQVNIFLHSEKSVPCVKPCTRDNGYQIGHLWQVPFSLTRWLYKGRML